MSMGRDWDSYRSETQEDNGEFARKSQLISSNIQKFQQNVSQIQRLVEQLGTGADSEQLRDKLHELQHSTNEIAKETNMMLKDLANLNMDARQNKLQRERLTNELMVVLNNFQSAQRQAAKKEKASVLRARANSGIPGSGGPFDTPAPSQQQQAKVQIEQNVDLEAIKEREGAIRQLEDDIVGVNQIFKDLATLVHEQGDMVDSIEQNVEQAAVSVDAGARNVQRASTYQDGARRKKCTLIIIGLVVAAVVALIVYLCFK